jgi:hypothetical protein
MKWQWKSCGHEIIIPIHITIRKDACFFSCFIVIIIFLKLKGMQGRLTIAILPKRDFSNTCSLGATHEGPGWWEPQVLPQVRLSHSLIQPYQSISGTIGG